MTFAARARARTARDRSWASALDTRGDPALAAEDETAATLATALDTQAEQQPKARA